jgi:hypothetical protein
VEPCSTSLPAPPFIYTFFTTERITSSPTHLYQDERALPGDLHNPKLSSCTSLLNVVSHTTTHFLFSLYFRLQSVKIWTDYFTVLFRRPTAECEKDSGAPAIRPPSTTPQPAPYEHEFCINDVTVSVLHNDN